MMRTVAYKLAKDHDRTKGHLPDEHITEWTYVDLHKQGEIISFDGWEFLPEDQFIPLLSR